MAHDALRQFQQPNIAALRPEIAAEIRRSAAQDQQAVVLLHHLLGHIAHMIVRVLGSRTLFVTGIVFLIDHNQAQIGEGGEQGRARPHDYADQAIPRPPPGVETLAITQAAVHDRHLSRKTGRHAPDRLRRQGDLRHQKQGLPSLRQRKLNRAQVNLRFAAAGNPVQQEDRSRFSFARMCYSFRGFRRRRQRFDNLIQHRLDFLHHLRAGKTKDAQPLAFQKGLADGVFLRRVLVNLAVDFDDEIVVRGEKIDDEAFDAVLAAEFCARCLRSHMLPETVFGGSWRLPHLPRQRLEPCHRWRWGAPLPEFPDPHPASPMGRSRIADLDVFPRLMFGERSLKRWSPNEAAVPPSGFAPSLNSGRVGGGVRIRTVW